MAKTIVIGVDLSPNHFGVCSIDCDTGRVFEKGFLTDSKRFLDTKFADYEYFLEWVCKGEDRDNFVARRREYVSFNIWNCILQMLYHFYDKKGVLLGNTKFDNVYVAMETYAYGVHSRGILENAEICGSLKNSLYCQNIKLRLVDPLSVKKWAVNKGHCSKKEMVSAAINNGFDVSTKLIKVSSKKVKDEDVEEYSGPGTDLADAYFLADMLRTELLVRKGKVQLEDLPVNKREIFLRVTGRNPENLAVRPFVER